VFFFILTQELIEVSSNLINDDSGGHVSLQEGNLVAKSVHNDVLDGALNIIKNNITLMTVCNAEPTSRTEAVTTYALADVAMTGTDVTVGEGDTNGRKAAIAAKTGVNVDTTGTATHVALVDGTRLLYVTTCTSQALTQNNTVDFPTWDIEIADPT